MPNYFTKGKHHPRLARPMAGLALLLAIAAPLARAMDRQKVSGGHIPAAAAHLAPVSNLPGSQRLNLAIGLPLRNQPELDTLLQQLYDPASPNYRRYLTTAQFTERFGPTAKDYQALVDFAKSKGLTVDRHASQSRGAVGGWHHHGHRESLPPDPAGLPASAGSAHLLRAGRGALR